MDNIKVLPNGCIAVCQTNGHYQIVTGPRKKFTTPIPPEEQSGTWQLLPTGYYILLDKETKKPILDPSGHPILITTRRRATFT